MSNRIVWFKKNLRFKDNEILIDENKTSILIYIIEPELWKQKDMSLRQWQFTLESVNELQQQLLKNNLHLNIFFGDALEIFKFLKDKYGFSSVISEQETGIQWTYERDKKLKKYFLQNNIFWIECPYPGVKRGQHDRNQWARNFRNDIIKYSNLPTIKKSINLELKKNDYPRYFYDSTPCPFRQKGGSFEAEKLLKTFLNKRGENYQFEMSSPITAEKSCSRLSTHLTYGTISHRKVFQEATKKREEIKLTNKNFAKSISSFLSRLHWRSHFIQKLEDQPSIEHTSFIPVYDQIRERDEKKLEAWINGKTGVHFIDACMIYLRKYGWINFRMRAMLASFASYNLWLDWRYFAPRLGALFTDFEPGIHYSQIQMQSGTTGINTIRMYNPYKQALDQDPQAKFIKSQLTKYNNFPPSFFFKPPYLSKNENLFNDPLIETIVDVTKTAKHARDKIFSIRKLPEHQKMAKEVYLRHGSRQNR